MESSTLKCALQSAHTAATSGDRVAFIVAVRVAQLLLPERLDLVRDLDEAIEHFPDEKDLQTVCAALSTDEDWTN